MVYYGYGRGPGFKDFNSFRLFWAFTDFEKVRSTKQQRYATYKKNQLTLNKKTTAALAYSGCFKMSHFTMYALISCFQFRLKFSDFDESPES